MDQYIVNDDIIKMEANERLQNRVPSEPVCIPGSPLKLTSSQQNSQESCEIEEEYYDGNNN